MKGAIMVLDIVLAMGLLLAGFCFFRGIDDPHLRSEGRLYQAVWYVIILWLIVSCVSQGVILLARTIL